MEVSYTTTLDDYVAYSLHTLKRSSSMKWRIGMCWALPPLACLIASVLLVGSDPIVPVMVAAGGAAYAIIYPFAHRAWVGQAIRAYAQDLGAQGVIGRITLILTNESMTERTETVQSVARWQDMKGMEVVGDCTYIYVTGLLTAIIPRHGFERKEDYDAVLQFAVQKLGQPA